jgi:DNA uptake protein ComE-like DNA-binding protein
MILLGHDAAGQRQLYRATGLLCATLTIIGVMGWSAKSPVQALVGDLAAIRAASDLDSDPQDSQAVAAVCSTCHAASQFLFTPRSNDRWGQVFSEMSVYGATGTDEQLNRLVAYFQKNLTVINVNTSPAEDLGPTLQVNEDIVAAIVTRRAQHPFNGVDDLTNVRGVNRFILEKLNEKKCLQF